MVSSSIHSTTLHCIQTVYTESVIWKLLMLGHGNREDRTGYGKVSKLDYINEEWVYWSTWCELPAKYTGMSQRYSIIRSENTFFSWSDIDMPQSLSMPLSIDTDYILAVSTDCLMIYTKLLSSKQQLWHVYGECEWSVINFWSCKLVNWNASWMLWFITHILATVID
jgi:hypothetical protein